MAWRECRRCWQLAAAVFCSFAPAACQRHAPALVQLPQATAKSSQTPQVRDDDHVASTSSSVMADLAPPLERVGNQDPRGVHDQPDWTAAAQALKFRVLPELARADLPSEKSQACREMVAQAREFYHAIEDDGRLQNASNHHWRAIFREEFAGCMDELSLRAVHCVTISLKARNAEYAWLVDQCVRAFPDAG